MGLLTLSSHTSIREAEKHHVTDRTSAVNSERVLVGIGDEVKGTAALDWVVQRAARKSVQVVVLAALDAPASDRSVQDYPLVRTQNQIRSALPDADVDVVPSQKLLLESLVDRSAAADLLVVGASPRPRLLSSLSRSFPFRVAARAHCATVIVPAAWHPSEGPIIVGIADDQSANRATLFAAREATDLGCELIVVHCWSVPATGDAVAASLASYDEWRASHLEILHDAVDRIRAAFPKVRLRAMLAHGRPGSYFEAHAENPSLVVLGTHHRGPLTELLLGSTARDALRAGCAPLAIVPLTRQAAASPK